MAGKNAYSRVSQGFGDLGIHDDNSNVRLGIHLDSQYPKTGHFLIPRPPSHHFIGRDEVLQRLSNFVRGRRETNDEQTNIVITGLGGLGKSELCLHLIDKVRGSFDNIFWVDVENHLAAEQGFLNISDKLKLNAQSFQQVVQYLSSARHTWLLVLDSANDPDTDFHPFLPVGSRGTVIMTSHNPECGQSYGNDHWEVLDVLGHSPATNLLMRAAGFEPSSKDRNVAGNIVEALGYHTLAILLAGSYIAEESCELDEYLEIYEKSWQSVIQDDKVTQGKARYSNVFATFELSMSALEAEQSETSFDALEILDVLSALAASAVPVALFKQAWEGIVRMAEIEPLNRLDGLSDWHVRKLPKFVQATMIDRGWPRMTRACNRLKAFSIITTSGRGLDRKLKMHTLAHDWLWERQTPEKMEDSWITAGSALSWWGNGDTEGSMEIWDRVLRLQGNLSEDHPERLASQHELAFACQVNGHTSKAIALLEHIVKIERDSLVQDHPARLASRHALATAYRASGQTSKAIAMLEDVVEFQEGSLAEDHPGRLASQYELALAYQANGQVGKAVALLQDVVKVEGGSLAEDHPDRLVSQHGLARAYQANGQVSKAITLLEHVVKVEESSLAEDHPDRLISQHALAHAYQASGQVSKTIALLEHVVKVEGGSLAEDHPDRLTSQHALATTYQASGQVSKAIALLEHVVKVEGGSLVEDHPDRLTSQHALARAYQANGQAGKAIALLEHIVKVEGSSLAEDHPDRLTSQHALARAYQVNGQAGKAIALLEHVVKVQAGILAETRQDRLTSQCAPTIAGGAHKWST
ncbi:hypothetical protein Q7P35_006603 [Cladosporium inversicolor]